MAHVVEVAPHKTQRKTIEEPFVDNLRVNTNNTMKTERPPTKEAFPTLNAPTLSTWT